MLIGRDYDTLLTVGLIKRHCINAWAFSRTETFKKKSESWIRFI